MSPRPVGVFPPRRPASRGGRSVCRVVDSCWSHYRRPGFRRVLLVSISGTSSVPVLLPGPPGWGASVLPSTPHTCEIKGGGHRVPSAGLPIEQVLGEYSLSFLRRDVALFVSTRARDRF